MRLRSTAKATSTSARTSTAGASNASSTRNGAAHRQNASASEAVALHDGLIADIDLPGSPLHTGRNQGGRMPTAFEEIMAVRGRGMPERGEVTFVGADPVLATRFKIGETCAAALAAVGVAVNDIWEHK